MKNPKFVLASKSPRRAELLKNLGVDFSVKVSGADESQIPKDLPPNIYVQELAVLKGTAVSEEFGGGSYVIAADTVVVFDGEIIGKPKDKADARRILKLLSNKTHKVYTGYSVTDAANVHTAAGCEVTDVHFKELTDGEIDAYIATGEPLDKAGAYGIQGAGSLFADEIRGDFFNVVGLPLCALNKLMIKEFNISLR